MRLGVTDGTLYISVVGTGRAVASISTVTFVNDTTGVVLAGDPGGEVIKMAITPDGRTVFIAGGAALIVQPTP